MNNEVTNYGYCVEALELKKTIEINFLFLGERLLTIRDNKLYASNWDAFYNFLDEMNMSEGTASKMINIYKKFVIDYGMSRDTLVEAGGWTKLAMILPIVNSLEEAQDWVSRSTSLSVRDLAKEIKEEKTGVQMKDCSHKDTYTVRKCRDCGEYWETYE